MVNLRLNRLGTKFHQDAEKANSDILARSSADLLLKVVYDAYRMTHYSLNLMNQRSIAFADRRQFKVHDNVLQSLVLAGASYGLYLSSRELIRRKSEGESLVSIGTQQELNQKKVVSHAVDVSLSLRQATTGKALFVKRELSTFGRVNHAVIALYSALRFGLLVAPKLK